MPQNKYRVFELSARAVMSYATQENGQWNFALDRAATEKCKCFSALHEQDSNALFFQIMCVLQGDDFFEPTDDRLIDGLSDAIFYMDFSGIFDRSSTLSGFTRGTIPQTSNMKKSSSGQAAAANAAPGQEGLFDHMFDHRQRRNTRKQWN